MWLQSETMASRLFQNCRFQKCVVCVSRIDSILLRIESIVIRIDSICATFDSTVRKIDLVEKNDSIVIRIDSICATFDSTVRKFDSVKKNDSILLRIGSIVIIIDSICATFVCKIDLVNNNRPDAKISTRLFAKSTRSTKIDSMQEHQLTHTHTT